MSTSAPIREVHDIPIIEPRVVPRELPTPDPGRWISIVPIRVPVKVPERVLR